jgi:hypothetical protein
MILSSVFWYKGSQSPAVGFADMGILFVKFVPDDCKNVAGCCVFVASVF